MKAKTKVLDYKRKREGKTDYKKRLKLVASKKPRLVIRKSLKNIVAQITEYDKKGDRIVIAGHSRQLIRLGWKGYRRNLPAAYLVGLLCGIKAKKAGVKEAIVDTGLYPSVKGSVIYAVVKGVIDAGVKVPHEGVMLPPDERLMGLHTKDPEATKANFEYVKRKILAGEK